MSAQDDKHTGDLSGSWETNWSPPPLSKPPESPTPIEEAIYRLEHAMHWMWDNGQTGTARADASAIKCAREEMGGMKAKLAEVTADALAAEVILQKAGRWLRHLPEATDLTQELYKRITSKEPAYRLAIHEAVEEEAQP